MPTRSSLRHADDVTRLQLLALASARRSWRRVSPDDISGSWLGQMRSLSTVVEQLQVRAAVSASEYGAASLAEGGVYRAPAAFVDPGAFAGYAADGRTLDGLLYSPATTAKRRIAGGMSPADALDSAGRSLDKLVVGVVADAARQSASVDIATRTGVGYVRVIVGETCRDCIALAGRWYKWNTGFLRHPGCDCIHEPATKALSEGAVTDPYEHFASLSEAEQDALWGAADAQAIRDGADIYRVYNAERNRRGRANLTTTARAPRGQRRPTPEGIYQTAKSRAEALSLLERHGYILPGGQVPGGSIRGQRVSLESAPRRTAAEQRLVRATARWDAVREGRNPNGGALTPDVAAQVERDYRRWLRTGGEVFA